MPMFSVSNILVVLSLLGAAQGVLFALALLGLARGNPISNRLLAALVTVISIFLLGAVLRTTGYEIVLPHLSYLHDPFTFLIGPLFYLYLKTLVTAERSFPLKRLLHFAPFALCVLFLSPYYLLRAEAKAAILTAEHQSPGLGEWYYVRSSLVIVLSLIYLVAAVVLLRQYLAGSKRVPHANDALLLRTAKFLSGALLLIWLVGVARFLFDPTSQTNLVVPLMGAMTVYGLGYMYLREPAAPAEHDERQLGPRYEHSTLSTDRARRYLAKLSEIMETQKPYKDGELTLQKLAEMLSITPAHLSQAINEHLDQSFSDYVNAYRVEEVKAMFLDPSKKHYSLLALAEEAGFSSKSSFNSVFKKHAGQTPSEYRKGLTRAAN